MTEEMTTLRLEGVLTIKTITETRDRLVAAFGEAQAGKLGLEIDIAEDCECDLTLPQLLMAAQKTATNEGVSLHIRAVERSALAATLKRAGISAAIEGGSFKNMNGDQR